LTSYRGLCQNSDPPQITVQPQSQSVSSGSNVTFTVSATGTAPLNFQWRLQPTELDAPTNIPAATAASLNLSKVSILNGGYYSVLIANSFGSVTSATTRLSIDQDLTFHI